MTYNFSGSWSGPGPLSPPDWMDRVLAFAETQVAPRRIVMGLGFYGREWRGSTTADLVWDDVEEIRASLDPRETRTASRELYLAYRRDGARVRGLLPRRGGRPRQGAHAALAGTRTSAACTPGRWARRTRASGGSSHAHSTRGRRRTTEMRTRKRAAPALVRRRGRPPEGALGFSLQLGGTRTVSMTWITPLAVSMSAVTTVASFDHDRAVVLDGDLDGLAVDGLGLHAVAEVGRHDLAGDDVIGEDVGQCALGVRSRASSVSWGPPRTRRPSARTPCRGLRRAASPRVRRPGRRRRAS